MSYLLILTALVLISFWVSLKVMPPKSSAFLLENDQVINEFVRNAFSRIRRRHDQDQCLTLTLHADANSEGGRLALRTLLPADPVYVHRDGKGRFEVFAGGFRVGRIENSDCKELLKMLDWGTLTGSYVARNSRNKKGTSLMVYYRPNDAREILKKEEAELCLS